MGDFVKTLKKFDDFFTAEGVGEAAVKEAEIVLGLKFSEEYAQYLKECGVAFADGHEFTGLAKSKRLNVVDVTETMRKNNPNISVNMYVVEELQIDGIVIWQSGDGKVYGTARDGKPELINSSLADYIMQDE